MAGPSRVDLIPAARKQLKLLPKGIQPRIVMVLEVLAETPRPPKAIKLVGRGDLWRVRTGDYRIIYRIEDERLVVVVVRIGRRGDVYRSLPVASLLGDRFSSGDARPASRRPASRDPRTAP